MPQMSNLGRNREGLTPAWGGGGIGGAGVAREQAQALAWPHGPETSGWQPPALHHLCQLGTEPPGWAPREAPSSPLGGPPRGECVAQRPAQPPVPLVSQDTAPRGPGQWEGPQGLGTDSVTGVRGHQPGPVPAVRGVSLALGGGASEGLVLAEAWVSLGLGDGDGQTGGPFGPGCLASNLSCGLRGCIWVGTWRPRPPGGRAVVQLHTGSGPGD